MTTLPPHIPVLLDEVVELLSPRSGQTLVDCTAGLGGHAAALARHLGPTGTVILFDLDPANLAIAAANTAQALGSDRVIPIQANFAWVARELTTRQLHADLLLADLGFASSQMDDPARGFSFRRPGPLDMRLDPASPISAAQIVNEASESELADLIYRFGEDRLSRRIARAIVAARAASPIESTEQLASIVADAYPATARHGPIHPATRTFQALRIAVNDELGNLDTLLAAIARDARHNRWLAPSARIAIITFHSLEDRPVKHAFRAIEGDNFGKICTKHPISASESELTRNQRARSAKLRVLELTKGL